ncbi:MAG TPA: acyl-CoA reductase [Candidatus Binatia bacterium]|nr:acyl-CoA reductase [Candidatus Binatia bacterium]
MRAMVARNRQQLFEPPLSTADELAAAMTAAERGRRDVVAMYSTDRIVTALARAAADWLRPDEPLRGFAIDAVARATGFHRDMIATGIDYIFSAVTADGLQRLAGAEHSARATVPGAVFYALAGNVPGQGIPAIGRALVAGSIAIVRDSERQPVITAAFRETLRRHEPALAAMVIPVAWSHRSGDRALESAVIKAAARVELYGSDRTVADLAARYRTDASGICELHGARVSAGLVPPGADLAQAARGFAVDLAMYEGRGCLTPHVILVEGAGSRASELADALGHELGACEARWPRARGTIEEECDRRRFIDDAEMRALVARSDRPNAERCLMGPSSAWCVHQSSDPTITLGPGLRCVRVAAVADRAVAIAALRAANPPLAGVGVAGTPTGGDSSGADDAALSTALRAAGATLVCPAGRMQAPPIDWRPDARVTEVTRR